MKKLDKKGVSLAELLAVVVIMGIIAAIAIPLVGNVIKTSERKAVLGDATTIAEAARTYCMVEDPDGKVEDGICKGGLVQLNGDGGTAAGDLEKFTPYVSKSFASIGADVKIQKDGEVFQVLIDTGKYVTGNSGSEAQPIDPTSGADLDSLVVEKTK